MSTATLPHTGSRLHVLEIVGNAIVGGMETSVVRLLERLPPERFGVTALCPFESPFTERLRTLGADVVITAIRDEPSWQSIQLACSLVRSSAVDVIHTHLPNAHVLGGVVGRLADKPVLATLHGRRLTELDLEVHRAAATHLAAVCRQSYLHALGVGVNPKQLHLVSNGVDTEVFAPGRCRAGALRSRWNVPDDAPLVGFVGRLSWEKGPDVLLRAAVSVTMDRPDIHFVLVGDGPMRESLQAFVDRFGLTERVHFAGVHDDMPAVFAELDLVVSPSRSEAMPLAVMEAMASGLPLVACRVGAVPDLIEQGVSGWLVDEGDADALAHRIVEFMGDADARSAAGRAGRARSVQRFSLSTHVEAMQDLLTRIAGRPSGRAAGSESRGHAMDLR